MAVDERVTSVFGAVAGTYAHARPAYPAELYRSLAELAGRALGGALVVDVGAGTGIAARQMRDRGARIVAIEPSAGMLAELAATSPGVQVIRGDGHALPLRADSTDFITYAQAWHWVDPARAVPELRRVLRPGGTFAAWWNITVRTTSWAREQERRMIAACPRYHEGRDRYPSPRVDELTTLQKLRPFGSALRTVEFGWDRQVPLDVHLTNLNSKSYVASLGPSRAAAFLDAERAALLARFPGGMITESYKTTLVAVRM
jgi:SAM-dependent methyltransferase